MLRTWCALACAVLVLGGGDAPAAAKPSGLRGSVCVSREPDLPIDEAGGLAPVAMPPGLYGMRVDKGKEIPVLPDRGTWVRGLDPKRRHVIALFRNHRRVTATRFRVVPGKPLCFGLSNYSGGISERPLAQCSCPK